MRLALFIKDIQYRDAFAQEVAESGNDIFLDIIHKGNSVYPEALIITDARPADIDINLLNSIKNRTVFLTTDCLPDSQIENINTVFKYSSVSRLLAEISKAYSDWKGIKSRSAPTSRIIACCSDSDAFSYIMSTRLASQIIYRHGGRVLILPLGYIREESNYHTNNINMFARLMYKIRKTNTADVASFTYTDSYGIYRLMLPPGRNPIAYLEEDDLLGIITALSRSFETLILDIGGCYRRENIISLKYASSVLCFQTGRRRIDFHELISEADRKKLSIINASDDSEEGFALDEYIKELYGIKDEY